MRFDAEIAAVRAWVVGLFARAINRLSRPAERAAAVAWLREIRTIVAAESPLREKIRAINAKTESVATARAIAGAVADSARNYRRSEMPLAVKIAIPATLAAAPFLGAQGVGLAALGGAIGAPALLLVFLGTAGLTAVIEAVAGSPQARSSVAEIVTGIMEAEAFRRFSRELREAVRTKAQAPRRADLSPEQAAMRAQLLAMDPYAFEAHVMAYFASAGLPTIVTPRSGDAGVDGIANHPEGPIVVQCKRYAPANRVGGPEVQQLMGCVQQNSAWRGYLVTTSSFTPKAIEAAATWDRIVLVDLDGICAWENGEAAII